MKKPDIATDPSSFEMRQYRVAVERVHAYIRDTGLAAGTRLPPERELAPRLGVSRGALREALLALELDGVVELRSGAGAWLCEVGASVPSGDTEPGPFEVLAACRLVESEIAATAAAKASASAIAAIERAMHEMERSHDNREDHERADRDFHMAVAMATGDSALAGTVGYLWDQRGTLWQRLQSHFQTDELHRQTLLDHRSIAASIAAHDPPAARAAMRSHFERVSRTFSRG